MNTHIAVLNKINAPGTMAVRASLDTNQLLVALLERQVAESKLRRDAEAAEIARRSDSISGPFRRERYRLPSTPRNLLPLEILSRTHGPPTRSSTVRSVVYVLDRST